MSAPRGLIVILATAVLLLEVGRWSHGEVFALLLKYPKNDLLSQKMVYKRDIPEKGVCNEIESHLIPYYGSQLGYGPGLYPIRYETIRHIIHKCCKGYRMSADKVTCLPICDEGCDENHGFCSEPHVCSCRSGYKKVDDNLAHKCEPICEHACTNGWCIAPGVCKCADGYEETKSDSSFACSPKCSEPCVFGTCVAPEVCTCDRGYKTVNASVCEPVCSKPCRNGVCVASETCSCNDGYRLVAESNYICEPICESNCINGICTAPGVCTCNKGFSYDNGTEAICKPHCEIPCGLNGKCVSPNNCICFDGYHIIPLNVSSIYDNSTEESRSICQPICDFKCINGECTAPNVCTCTTGYYPSWIEPHQQSLSFNDKMSRVCEPVCSSCGTNEICIAPNVCTCKDGYEKNTDGHCLPVCAQACANGTCTEPNRCTCNGGFESQNGSACEPICENGCQNGDCIAPNHCVCRENFMKNINHDFPVECISACTRNCSRHGRCVIKDDSQLCMCNFGWKGWDCQEPTMCAITMNFSRSDINKIVIINDTNSATMQTFADAPYCYQCDNFRNTLLCHVVYSEETDEAMPLTANCLLRIDLSCYTMPSSEGATIAWLVIFIAVLIVMSLMATVYITYCRYQRNKLNTEDLKLYYSIKDMTVTNVEPVSKLIYPQDFHTEKSQHYDAAQVIDGDVAVPFVHGAKLKIFSEDFLQTPTDLTLPD